MPRPPTQTSAPRRRIGRRHLLLLALAAEIVLLGAVNADRYRPAGITVEQTVTHGHVIT